MASGEVVRFPRLAKTHRITGVRRKRKKRNPPYIYPKPPLGVPRFTLRQYRALIRAIRERLKPLVCQKCGWSWVPILRRDPYRASPPKVLVPKVCPSCVRDWRVSWDRPGVSVGSRYTEEEIQQRAVKMIRRRTTQTKEEKE